MLLYENIGTRTQFFQLKPQTFVIKKKQKTLIELSQQKKEKTQCLVPDPCF